MTETEIKAKELVELYKPYTYHGQQFTSMEEDAENCLNSAKQCALIAVDREIQSFSNFFALHYSKTIDMDITIAFSEHIKSLKAIRAEIEKL